MKVRESGMPDELNWKRFFDVLKILESMEVNNSVEDVAEFGCGYGTFTLPTARIISGKLFAFDIEPDLVQMVMGNAEKSDLTNIVGITRDFVSDGTGLDHCSVDYVMLFNILHAENPLSILKEAERVLRPGGRLGIIHWNYDNSTPRGPPMSIRPRPDQCEEWAKQVGFRLIKLCDLKPFHYGLLFSKENNI